MALWLEKLAEVATSADAAILITVLETKGSIPREVGTKMVVTSAGCFDTVGGGNLEYQCIAMAQERLGDGEQAWLRKVHRFPLGASLGQCCGGLVLMLLEYIDHGNNQWIAPLQSLQADDQEAWLVTSLRDDAPKSLVQSDQTPDALTTDRENYFVEHCLPTSFPIMLFGAGHVGRALVDVLAGVDCSVSWVDSRAEQFPLDIPNNTQMVVTDDSVGEIKAAPANTCFLVMTHSHQVDQQICEAILRRDNVRFCGLIGSLTKKRRFEQRLSAKGFSDEAIARLTCPIGLPNITGKEPSVIAISVAAQLLALNDSVSVGP
mgnify:CR=1 FL=1